MKNKVSRSAVIKRIFASLKPYRFSLVLSVIFGIVGVSLTLAIPVLVGRAVDLMVGAGAVDRDGIGPILWAIAGAAALSAVFQWLMTVVNNRITYNVTRDLRRAAFRTLQAVPVSYFDSRAHGGLVSRVITDVDAVSDGLLLGASHLFTGVVTVAGTRRLDFLMPTFSVTDVINMYTFFEMAATEVVEAPEDADVAVTDRQVELKDGATQIRSCDFDKILAVMNR